MDENTPPPEAEEPAEPRPTIDPPPTAGPPPPRPSWGDRLRTRPLRRDPNGPIGGVAGGLAQWLEVDAALIRVAIVVLAFFGGSGLIFYLAAWLLIPAADDPAREPLAFPSSNTAKVLGIIAMIVGVSVALGNMSDWTGTDWLIPALLVGGGVAVLSRSSSVPATIVGSPPPPAAGTAPMPPAPAMAGVGVPPPPTSTPDPRLPVTVDQPHWATARLDETPVEPQGPPITAVTISVAAVAAGLLLVLDTAGVIDLSMVVLAGSTLAIVGLGLITSAFLGRAPWLIPLGLLAALALSIAPIADASIDGGVGDRNVVVDGLSELQPRYQLGVGELLIDLTDLELDGTRQVIAVDLGVGYTEIHLPRNATVEITGDVDIGYLNILGHEDSGFGAHSVVADDGTSTGTIVLDVEVGIGAAEVRRG
ncbi:MAG: PspC domain-containing protein [Actinomycetia bacterium]|nr:PspC domain-containing protein [Actinomycetes bacterium]